MIGWLTTCRNIFRRRRYSPKLLILFCCFLLFCVYRISRMESQNSICNDFHSDDHQLIMPDSNNQTSAASAKGNSDTPNCERCRLNSKNQKLNFFEKGRNRTIIHELLSNYSDYFYNRNSSGGIAMGGFWAPRHCKSKHNTAIIVPYRQREAHLHILIAHLHAILQEQLIAYGIFVAEQSGNGTFNKGILMNAAFKWINGAYDDQFNCFIFHDVDLLLENLDNLYECSDQPKHLSPAVSKLDYKLPYQELIGGVLAFRPEQYRKVNGYSNVYWGWGGEDDDMYRRLKNNGLKVSRPSLDVGRYFMMNHEKRTWLSHSKTYELLGKSLSRMRHDGLSNVKTGLISVEPNSFYTRILVDFVKNSQ